MLKEKDLANLLDQLANEKESIKRVELDCWNWKSNNCFKEWLIYELTY